jgi:hypothetical protein
MRQHSGGASDFSALPGLEQMVPTSPAGRSERQHHADDGGGSGPLNDRRDHAQRMSETDDNDNSSGRNGSGGGHSGGGHSGGGGHGMSTHSHHSARDDADELEDGNVQTSSALQYVKLFSRALRSVRTEEKRPNSPEPFIIHDGPKI